MEMTYNILDLFKECVKEMPKEVYDEFSYWCLGKNDADTLDISISLDDYIEKIKSIINGIYEKPYKYVHYISLNRKYSGLYKEYWPIDYDNGFRCRLKEFAYYENNHYKADISFSFFIAYNNYPKSKPKLTFNNLRSNPSFLLVINDRFNNWTEFCLLKTAAFWTEFLDKYINKLGNDYVYMFNIKNRKFIYTFDYLPEHKVLKKLRLNMYNNKQVINNMIYDNSRFI